MKSKIIFIALLCFITVNLSAKSKHSYFFRDCIEQTKKLGAKEIIVSAQVCSACAGTFEAVILYKLDTFFIRRYKCSDFENHRIIECADTVLNTFHYRYLKYYNAIDGEMKVLKDSTIKDSGLQFIFKIANQNKDSILSNLKNIVDLNWIRIRNTNYFTNYTEIADGVKDILAYYNKESYEFSFISTINGNGQFENAYYYWLLQSLINNYLADTRLLQLRHEFKYKKKHR